MKKIFSAIAVLTAFAMVAVSCNDDDTKDEDIPVTEVKVTPTAVSVVAGTTTTLKAEVLPENATNKTVEWVSRTLDIATIDKEGVVTGVAEGEAEIMALCGDKYAKVIVTVTAAPIRVNKITLSKTDLPLFVGKTEKLTYTIDPENATDQTAVWDSGNKTVATIADDGTVTALAEGTTDITLTIDEKTATCKVTVSVPEMESIATPYLKDLTGNTVKMTAAGFKAGDKVNLEDFFGYTGSADVKDITAADAAFDLPADAPKDRSLKITIIRDGKAICVDYIRYDSEMVKMAASLGYALTAKDEVVTDGSIAGFQGNLTRKGYVKPAAVFQYNATDGTFDAAPADLKLCTFTPAENGAIDLSYVTGAKDISGMKYFDLSGVTSLNVANTLIEELDMTLFPNCATLLAWGDPGMGDGRFKKVNFGIPGTNPASQLTYVQLERNQITSLDLRNCTSLKRVFVQDNQITSINLGTVNEDGPLNIEEINLENNQIRNFSTANCGWIRRLGLKGNPIVKLNLTNMVPNGCRYMYLYKAVTDSQDPPQPVFTLTWATLEQANGEERVFDVEQYWWRVLSAANIEENDRENNKFVSYEDWVGNGPIVQALKDGVKVICWTYFGEGGVETPHAVDGHVHEGGSDPCTY